MTLTITAFDPAAPNHVSTFPAGSFSKLKYSSAVNGGFLKASWTVDCGKVPGTALPDVGYRVTVRNERNKLCWQGTLRKPTETSERGILTEVDFFASGYGVAPIVKFAEPLTFGPSPNMATTQGNQWLFGTETYVVITDLKDMMLHGLTHMPLITGSQLGIATTGILPLMNTEPFRGRTAPELWNAVCALTNYLGTPYCWLVYPDNTGAPSLYFLAEPTTVEYWDRGRHKRMALAVDADEIANVISVGFQGAQTIYAPDLPNGAPIDYSAIFDIQTHHTDVSAEIRTAYEAQAFAQGLLAKFNKKAIVEGSITLDEPVRARYIGTGPDYDMMPITEIRAGHTIEVRAPKTPYTESRPRVFIRSCEYDDDACEVTLNAHAFDQDGKDARKLLLLDNRAMTWAAMSTQLGPAGPDLQKLVASSTVTPSFVPPVGVGPGSPSSPVQRKPAPNAADLPQFPPLTGDPNQVQLGLVAGVLTSAQNHEFGEWGMQSHPRGNPPERINIPGVFSTSDDTGALDDGPRLGGDVQAAWCDNITLRVVDGTPMDLEVHVDVYNWVDDTTDSDVFQINLIGEAKKWIRLDDTADDANGKHGSRILRHGDHLIWRVVGATVDGVVSCSISGWKLWPWFPDYEGGPYVPGN